MFPPPSIASVHAGDAGVFEAVGAHVGDDGVSYRVWAPDHPTVSVRIENVRGETLRSLVLDRDPDGHFSGRDRDGRAGDLYRYELGGEALPDPASRFQPRGVEGPSQVIDPGAYAWRTGSRPRPPLQGRVIYELHVGTFTPEGTFRGAISKLDALVDLGVNTLEILPVADFAGERNWGYDGVMLFAPARCYGSPDDLRALIDAAHLRGLAVVLDVVYNHLGAVGNVLPRFTGRYFHPDRSNIWGKVLNFDTDAEAVRRFFLQNTCVWLDEYRLDGLRIDAVHAIEDESPRHIVADLASAAHARGAFVIAEDERNEVKLITPTHEGGWALDGVWADDFHHTVRVAVTREQDAHYASFRGTLAEWADTLREGWLYHGQHAAHLDAPRGTPAGRRPPEQFVHCISNHDQVGNRPTGDRLHHATSPDAYRALSMLLCLTPYTPMLFMGQEWAADTPFVFFTDLPGEIGAGMTESRRKEFERYGANYSEDVLAKMPDPQSEEAFASSKLDWAERERESHRQVLDLYRACLGLRAREKLFQSPERGRWTAEKLGEALLGIRWKAPAGDWLLLVGVVAGEHRVPHGSFIRNQPNKRWQPALASNDPAYGGVRPPAPVREEAEGWVVALPGAVLFREV